MSNPDEIINAALVRLRQQHDEWEQQRPPLAAPTVEEHQSHKLERYLKRPITNVEEIALAGEDLLEEFTISYRNWGGRPVPDEVQNAIKAKIEQAQAQPKKNKGGAQFKQHHLWAEVVRIVIDEGAVPSRDMLRKMLLDYIAENDPDGGPSESTIRTMLQVLEEHPGIYGK